MPTPGIAGEVEHDWTMRRLTFAGTCLVSVSLVISGHTAFGQSQQRGGSSSSSGGSYGASSSSRGSSSTSRSTSSSSYGTSSSSYGTSSSSYGTSRNTYGGSRNTYGSSSGSQTRRSTSSYETASPIIKQRSANRLYLPIILAGKVIIEGAEGLPEPVVIRMGCGTQSLPQIYTDRRGRFSFQPSCNPVLAMSDASARTAFFGTPGFPIRVGRGGLNLSNCWLFAEFPGHRSDRLWLGMTRPMSQTKVGTIVLSPIEGASGDPVSFTTLTAPKKARKAYEKAARALRSVEEPNYAKAIPLLERAVELHPEFAAAWEALGRARRGLGDTERAREAFERSIEIDGRFLKPYPPLIEMAVADEDWTELESLTDRYLAMSPGSMEFRFYNSFAALENGNLSKAELMVEMIENAGEMDSWPLSYLVLAEVHTGRGEFEQAAMLYETYLSTFPNGQHSEDVKRILHDWSELRIIDPVDLELSTIPQPARTTVASSASEKVAP